MTSGQSSEATCESTDDWPSFELTYTFNPTDIAAAIDLAPDELVVFAPAPDGGVGESWVTAERGSYVNIENVR